MENLNKMDFTELNASEMKQVQGGRRPLPSNYKLVLNTVKTVAEDVVDDVTDLLDEIL